ncbi:fimbrial protein [Pseudomonas chlororaphis]|uniref:fimbrial protein n=1 Tax=Pseudomonas chlororaphis TaxID=587753 RepID=UPI0030D42E73
MTFKKILSTLMLVTTLAGAHSAFAVCKSSGVRPPGDTITVRPLADTQTLSPVAIGKVMGSQVISLYGYYYDMICDDRNDKMNMSLDVTGLEPAGLPNVYKTNIEGVGIQFLFSSSSPGWPGDGYMFPPFEIPARTAAATPFLNYLVIRFIRTGSAVGKGSISFGFSSDYWATGVSPIKIVGKGVTTNVTNSVYFSSCEAQTKNIIVPMGKVVAANIRNGNTQAQNFNLNVYCKGLRPTQPAPVKIYFEGPTTSDGLLKFNDAGQSHVASGAAIELTNGKGVRLPFNEDKALNLDWQQSQPDAEVYHFAGQARYVPSGGEVKAGKADAVLSYVLVYN